MLALVVTIITLNTTRAFAQSETPKFELGAQFSLLDNNRIFGREQTEPGFGGRFGYNAHKNFAVEAEINFFPRGSGFFADIWGGGRIIQGLFGVKAGKRFERFGLFGKVRPGFLSYNNALLSRDFTTFDVRLGRLTHPALDLGGVVEVYPSSRTLVRFDLGDTIVHYGKQDFISSFGAPLTFPSFTRHNVQFSIGFGLRF